MARSKTTEGTTVSHLWKHPQFRSTLGWFAAIGTTLVLLLALGSFNSGDWPSKAVAVHNAPPANLLGSGGAALAYWTYAILGYGVWPVLALVVAALVARPLGYKVEHLWLRAIGAGFLLLACSALHALWFPTLGPVAGVEAGVVPQWIAGELSARFSGLATSLILLCAAGIGAIVAADEVVSRLPAAVMRGLSFLEPVWRFDYGKLLAPLMTSRRSGQPVPAMAGAAVAVPPSPAGRRRPSRAANVRVIEEDPAEGASNARLAEADEEEEELEDSVEDEEEIEDAQDESEEACEEEESEDEDEDADEDADAEDAAEEDEEAAAPAPRSLSAEELRTKIAMLPVRMANAQTKPLRDEDIPRTENYEGYKFPTLELLEDPEGNFSEQMEAFVREQAGLLEQTLRIYQIEGSVTGIESGPVVTLYSVELAPGTRVARLQTIATDIARALGAPNIRIISNMVGRTEVGIEVPNKTKEKVRIKELMSGPAASKMALPMFLGKDSAGEPLVLDLAKQPHMLIAGTTGSGKSVCMNTIIMSWLYTKRPDELKLVLVDPKMVEMAQFSEIPHLMSPVVTDMSKAAGILEWAVRKMEERYELLKNAGVRDLTGYNQLGEEELRSRMNPASDVEWARTPKKLPYMVFVIDELADLMMTHKEVESSIVRIAQKARAVGMHLVLATQRPQANVVTGLIKANMPCRVTFKVASGMDSRIVLDQKGGELLLGQGDMLVLTNGSSELRRAQGTLVTDTEARSVTKFLKEVAKPSFERTLVAIKGPGTAQESQEGEGGVPVDERDPLFDRAVEVLIESGRGSVSLLQRRLAIGYGRASRLVDQMGRAGILGEHKGSVHRDVLITLEDWQRMKALEAEGAEMSEEEVEAANKLQAKIDREGDAFQDAFEDR
ncbi:MAG: DNA translocase FtsK 4TM domain-containing protein [Phycisphaerales bacterium]